MDAAAAAWLLLYATPIDEANLSIDLTIDPRFSEAEFFVFVLDSGVGVAAETSLAFLLKKFGAAVGCCCCCCCSSPVEG